MSSRGRRQSIFRHLRERIVSDLSSGALECGDRLPSVRELGEQLDADPRVVLTVYEQLAEEGLVEIRPRSGVFATGALVAAGDPVALPRRWMLETLVAAVQRGIPVVRFGELIQNSIAKRRLRAALIECNTDQLQSMREELERYFGLEVVTVELGAIALDAPALELCVADLLISGGHESHIARIAGALGKPYIITRVRPALVARLVRLLARGPVYFLVVDPRFGEKMRRLIAPLPASQNFHVLVVDEADLRVIPAGAPTYVMRGVGARLENKPHLGRVIATQRIFSEATSREILARILELASDVTSSV